MGHAGSAALGLQPSHEHLGAVRPSAGGLGGGEDGPLPPHPGAGRCHLSSLSLGPGCQDPVNKPFACVCATGLELPHSRPGPDPLRAKSEGDCDRRAGAVRRLSGCV